MPRLPDTFVPAAALANAHAQTVVGTLWRRRLRGAPVERQRFELPDGDFIDVDVLKGQPGKPTVLLFHGLEGSSGSGYIKVMLSQLAARGWSGVALNFRSCSGAPNRLAASYSSGDTRDALYLARHFANRQPLYAVGFSLGGSVLLNLVADFPGCGVMAAAAVSTPYELDACAASIDSGRGLGRVYLKNFLPTMKAKALEKAKRFPFVVDARRIAAVRTIREFDACFTAPLFGFESAEAYYQRSSTAAKLGQLSCPTLLVSADDDPLAPALHLPPGVDSHPNAHVLVTRRGGHVGFLGPGLTPWVESVVLDWFGTISGT